MSKREEEKMLLLPLSLSLSISTNEDVRLALEGGLAGNQMLFKTLRSCPTFLILD
jgi:hypothetical protein